MARPGGSGPPLSFKTVPGRHRTQKWNYAKQYDYSGDDWGGYDAYDDYGDAEPQQQQQYSAPPAMAQQPNWSPTGPYGGLPSQQQRPGRQMSFDEQEERRQFSAGPVMYGASGMDGPRGVSPAKSGTSSQGKRSGESRNPRDFTNPEQVPPPLNTGSRASPALSAVTAPPGVISSSAFPPRKSSTSNSINDSPASEPVRPSEKELPAPPFIRPSDIYKRMAAEQEKERRASESSSRPSMDDVNRGTDSSGNLSQVSKDRRPLSAVDEGVDMPPQEQQQSVSVPEGFGEPREAQSSGQQATALPTLTGVSSFGNDWFPTRRTTEEQNIPTSATTVQSPGATSTPSMQTTPIATRAPDSGTVLTSSEMGQQYQTQPPPDSLSHQPSQGYRSVVNRAFDHSAYSNSGSGSVPATPISRDNSHSTTATSEVSRSNTDSTSNISPIMSRVPSAVTAQMQRQQQAPPQPTITEEQPPAAGSDEVNDGSTARDVGIAAGVAATGAAAIGVASGYRRNFSPPSTGSSPARTPALDSGERRLSEGLAAETVSSSEAPTVPDQGVEMQPDLTTATEVETPASEVGEMAAWRDGVRAGRARAGTDYSMRESDIADAVSKMPSPEQPDVATMSPAEAASAEKAEQNLFLQTHRGTPTGGTPTTQLPAYPGFGGTSTPPPRTATPVSGRASPAKGNRVRELTDRFQQIHEDSRRNSQASISSSKSSWSRFGSQDERGPLPQRSGTQDSNVISESNYDATDDGREIEHGDVVTRDEGTERPGMAGREESFRPQLPGGWVSFRGDTPAPAVQDDYSPVARPGDDEEDEPSSRAIDSQQDAATPRASYEKSQQAVDLTPTIRSSPFQQTSQPSQFAQVKDAGSALGASLLTTVGMSHGTRDFGSSEPAEPVDQPEMRPKAAIGDVQSDLQAPHRPWLERGDTETTNVTDIASAASSVPPTPPAKDTPPAASFAKEADYNYFSGVPLRTGRTPELAKSIPASGAAESGAPAITPAFSVQSRASDMESDRLRREIVKSLDDAGMKQRMEEDTERTQDALDAPENLRRVELGDTALSPAEQQQRPLLDQRFSWERPDEPTSGGPAELGGQQKELPPPPKVLEPEPEYSPEIKPEMPYERPRSRGLHIMNADDDDDNDAAAGKSEEALEAPSRGLSVATSSAGPVSPITKSQENLHLSSFVDATKDGGEGLTAPSPVASEGKDGSLRLPSYYMLDIPGLESAGKSESGEASGAAAPTRDIKELGPKIEDVDRPSSSDDAPPRPPSKDLSTPTSPTSKQKIPPFREILAIKSSSDRIKTYDDTRRTFADMDTGLSDWLSGMLAQHPELASLSTPHGGYGQASDRLASMKGHKQSPSLAKFTRQFSSSNTPSPSQGTGHYQPGAEPMPPAKTTPSKDGAVDMDELKQRGKDLMKNASVLGGKVGGKASAGAKGLLAKGKNRFGSTREARGGSKDLSSNPSQSNSSSTLTSIGGPKVLDRSDPNTILQPTPVYISRTASPSSSLVPARSQTQTPTSISSSSAGPLSRTLSRLRRERSNSKSGSNSRQGSRPRSLIVGSSELGSIKDASPVAARVVVTEERQDKDVLPTVISPWSEPDASSGSHPDVETSGVPDRLGVLPSPTAGSFSRSIDSRPRTAVSDLDSLGASSQPTAALDPDQVLAQDKEDGSNAGSSAETQEGEATKLEPPRTPVTKDTTTDERDELYDVTPIISRSLPTRNAEAGDEDDTTPKAVQTEWQSSAIDSASPESKFETGQDGGMTIEEIARLASEDETMPGAEGALLQPHAADAETNVSSAGHGADAIASISPIPENTDNTSEVSAEDHEESNREVKTETPDETPSKRSSISSLGNQQQHENQQELPVIMSSQAVPAGPVYSMGRNPHINIDSDTQISQDRGFMDRTYLSRPEIPRPLSYEPRDRDSSGEIIQETLNSGSQSQDAAKDIENADGSKPFEANFTSLSRHRKQSQSSPTDRKSKRLSGIFAGRDIQLQQPQVPPQVPPQAPSQAPSQIPSQPQPQSQRPPQRQSQPTLTRAPPASFMPDEYGLGDLRDLHADSHDDVLDDDISRRNSKQSRRKSGFWEALKRNPSASREDSSRNPSGTKLGPQMNENVRPPPPQGWANDPRRMPVEQPQRAYTTATEPEKKKKRFSGLGSIFGRSSTTGHKADKSKKLSQQPVMGRENSQIQTAPAGRRIGDTEVFMVPKAPPPNTGWIDPYAMTGKPPPGSTARNVETRSQTARAPAASPPPGGWYGPPNNDLQHNKPTPSGQPRQTPPNFSRLPSHGSRGGVPMNQIPEAFRSAEASYNRPMVPVQPPRGSPAPRLSLQSAPPTTSPSQRDRMSYPPVHPALQEQQASSLDRERQPSSPSAEYALSPQVSGQSEWLRSERGQRGSMPTISPVESKPGSEGGYPPGRTLRVGSINEEVARSPAREYSDQQTPYMLSMPQGTGQAQSTRTSYYARQRRTKPNQQAQDTMQGRSYGPSASADPSLQGYPLSQQQTNASSLSEGGRARPSETPLAHAPTVSEPVGTTSTDAAEETYAPPPGPPPSSRTRSSRQAYIASFQQSQPHVNVRTSRDETDAFQRQAQGTSANPYLSLQLPNLGDSNRRNDHADDERIEMKSASYPGQEWIPSSWNE